MKEATVSTFGNEKEFSMPEKSVREMSELERQHYSLAARTFHATVMGAAVLGLVAFLIGLGLYTDGVPEADNEEKKMFGAQRMLEVLNRNAGETPAVILANTREAIRAFAGTEEQFDDITMLCLEYKGKN